MTKTFTITDDSGFLGLVNSENYRSYVDSDWSLDELFNNFLNEINLKNLLLWSTNSGGVWRVIISSTEKPLKSLRSFSHYINVTNQTLYLINYEDLTYAAQFEDITLPLSHNADKVINLDNGLYLVKVEQLETDQQSKSENDWDFFISLSKLSVEPVSKKEIAKIPWNN